MMKFNKENMVIEEYKELKVEKLRVNTRTTLVTKYKIVIKLPGSHTLHRKGMSLNEAIRLRSEILAKDIKHIVIEQDEDYYRVVMVWNHYYGFHSEKLNLATAFALEELINNSTFEIISR